MQNYDEQQRKQVVWYPQKQVVHHRSELAAVFVEVGRPEIVNDPKRKAQAEDQNYQE